MKNKQVVIELHEGCLDPNDSIIQALSSGGWSEEDQAIGVKKWLRDRLLGDSDAIIVDKVTVIDCDCEVGE